MREIVKEGVKTVLRDFPLVSIVVLNWNGERVIRSSLDSIRKLDYPNKEVIVVDNGSKDTSVDIIRKEYREFRLIENLKNLGFSAGMNVGIKESRGGLILLHNNDAFSHPTSLSLMVNTILSRTKIGIVGGLILYHEPNDVIWSFGGKLDVLTGTIWSDGLGQKFYAGKNLKENEVTDIDYLSGCVLLIKREVVQRIGLLDEESAVSGQDLDWCLKARRAGFECVLNPSAKIWHIGSYSLRHMPLRSYALRQESDFRVIMLHFPLIPMFSALLFQLLVTPIFELLFFGQSDVALRSRLKSRLYGFCENLKNVRNLLSRRRQIAKLGVLRFKVRTFELLMFTIFRVSSKEFYMGRFLKRVE